MESGHSNKRLSFIIMATEGTNEKHFARDIIMTSLVGVRDVVELMLNVLRCHLTY